MILFLLLISNLFAANDLTVQKLTINAGASESVLPTTRGTAFQALKTDGAGTLSWAAPIRFTALINYVTGNMPITSGNYVTSGGTLQIDYAMCAFSSSANGVYVVNLDSWTAAGGWVNRASVRMAINPTSVHTSFIPGTILMTGIAANTTMQFRFTAPANITADSNDYYHLGITEF